MIAAGVQKSDIKEAEHFRNLNIIMVVIGEKSKISNGSSGYARAEKEGWLIAQRVTKELHEKFGEDKNVSFVTSSAVVSFRHKERA